jgi:DNA mismatch repair protein MutL
MKVASTDEMVADNFGLGSKLLDQLANVRSEQKKMEGEDLDSASVKLIGKLFNTYILVEYASSLYLIDQHAAHERILYEKFKRECDNNTIAVQPLMFPYLLTLKPAEYTIIEQYLPQIRELGFDADEFGDNTIKISSVPLMLADIDFESFFSGFLDEARANTITKQSDVIKEKLMQHSCKSAIKGGNDISKNEVESLFRCMNEEKIPLFCPHGRPIAVRVAKTEIEKWFKRIV